MQMLERWATRSDSWTSEDDRRLADIVLRHIREGSTQLKAFTECADLLGRTAAACGYRWNGVVRKHFEDEIKQAKLIRKKRPVSNIEKSKVRYQTNRSIYTERSFAPLPIQTPQLETNRLADALTCIQAFAASFKDLQAKNILLEESITRLKQRILELEEENNRLKETPVNPISQGEKLNEDSKTLLAIMERARKMLDLEPESNEPKVKFRMDRNGNLERIHV